jgi:hypothetical protein
MREVVRWPVPAHVAFWHVAYLGIQEGFRFIRSSMEGKPSIREIFLVLMVRNPHLLALA